MKSSEDNVLTPLPGNGIISRNSPRMFRSPPQPHMCVQDTLKGTQTVCFINVMSWGRIAVPSEPNAPMPLYGGVEVPLSERYQIAFKLSNICKERPIVFAVMVNPSVLKERGKLAENKQDRNVLIDLILDFVEAMNENITFSRKFTVLSDRDLTGELKDIWAIIQSKREAEKKCNDPNMLTLQDENSQPNSSQSLGTSLHAKSESEEASPDKSNMVS